MSLSSFVYAPLTQSYGEMIEIYISKKYIYQKKRKKNSKMETGSQYRIYSVANHALSPKRVTDPKNGKD